jgi:hypothetical protein
MDRLGFCAIHPIHYATLASNASGLIPPRATLSNNALHRRDVGLIRPDMNDIVECCKTR